MEKLSLVRDASRSSKENVVTTRGYHGCMAVACKSGARKTVPLDLKIWSSLAEGHKGENEEVLDVMRAVDRATDGRGIRVYDRGISHDRRSPRSGALAWVGQTRLLRLQARQREEVHYTHEPEGPLELEGDEVKRMARWPRESSGRSCATEAGRRKPWSRRRTTDVSPAEGVPKGLATRGADAAGMGRVVVPRRRIARGRAKRRGVLRVRKPGAASVGETCARNQ